jgi:hypothetical protein
LLAPVTAAVGFAKAERVAIREPAIAICRYTDRHLPKLKSPFAAILIAICRS